MQRRSRVPRFPFGLLGMIPLLILTEWGLALNWIRVTPPPTLSWRLSEDATRGHLADKEVLCLGDSLLKHGLLSMEFERITSQATFNLAVSAAQAPTTYYLLKHAIDRGAHPRTLILEFSPDLLMGSPRESLRNYPEILSTPELLELARSAKDLKFATSALIARAFPSIRARFEIRSLVGEDLVESDESPSLLTALMLSRNWRLNQGAQFTPDRPEFTGEVTEADLERLNARRFWCNRINRIYIERTLTLARMLGSRVVWLVPPVAPGLQKVRDESGAEDKHTAFLDGFLKRFPELIILDARRAGLRSDQFVDPIHLSGKGAMALTRAVGTVLPSSAGSNGWIRLAVDSTPIEAPYENLHQSQSAVSQGLRTLR